MKTLDANLKKSTKYKWELKNNHEFTLKHFAKDVKYNIDGFIFKNQDTVSGNMKATLQNS